jgi:hypothetical protein
LDIPENSSPSASAAASLFRLPLVTGTAGGGETKQTSSPRSANVRRYASSFVVRAEATQGRLESTDHVVLHPLELEGLPLRLHQQRGDEADF